MKLQRISFLAALVAALVLTGCGSSGIGDILGGSRDTSTNDPYNRNINNVRGTVERVNTTERYIVVDAEETTSNLRNGGDEVVLYYDDRTTVEFQGRTYRPADLEAGDRILADVDSNGSRLMVEEIQVLYDVTSNTTDDYADDRYDDDRYDNDRDNDRYDTRTTEVRGTVRYVDTRDQTLELEPSTGRTGLVVVHYDSSTIVEFEGRRYRPENLERGDRVEVEVHELNGRMIAEEILVVGEALGR